MRAASLFPLVLLLVLAGPVRGAHAQTRYDPDRNQALGAIAGAASGAGVSYEEVLPSGFGYRGALVFWSVGDFSFFDFGVSGLRLLGDDRGQRIYLVGSLAYWRRSDEERETLFDGRGNVAGERVFDDVDDSWAMGFGAGLQRPIGERVAVTLEALFTYWAESGDVLPLPQIGIGYRF